jgi:cell wall-associated NlpC family hydrolase
MAFALVTAVSLVVVPASAEPPTSPDTGVEVEAAREAERLAEASVAELEEMLDDLRAASEAAAAAAGLAAETYNQAAVNLAEAESTADQAVEQAAVAGQELESARGMLARVAMSTNEAGSELAVFEPFWRADALAEALAQAELIQMAGTASGRAADGFAVAEQAAQAASARADEAVAIREDIAQSAERAATKAQRAADAAIRAQEEAETEHTILLGVLATRRGTTAQLEAQAELARIEAENARAAEAARAAQPQASPTAQAEQAEAPEAPASSVPTTPSEPESTATPPADDTQPPPTSPPPGEDPAREPDPAPSPSSPGPGTEVGAPSQPTSEPASPETPPTDQTGGATSGVGSPPASGEGAVAWARSQLGKPYHWGAAGPDGFDCSGLTSMAWRNGGGLAIPRVAASQYTAAAKVGFDQMRPGDLIFWGSSAAAIHHVAIYSGSGMMIEAPRAGGVVQEIPVRWVGVFGYAGRF